jgi:hypothetical protein
MSVRSKLYLLLKQMRRAWDYWHADGTGRFETTRGDDTLTSITTTVGCFPAIIIVTGQTPASEIHIPVRRAITAATCHIANTG